jgi:large subunit ribosomal protein L21
MYAIVDIAGQQFKVEKDQKIFVHRLEGEAGSNLFFDRVLLIDNGKNIIIGNPLISDALISVKILSHLKGDKVKIFKKKRRKGYQKLTGHRQFFTEIQINEILEKGGSKAMKDAAARKPEKEAVTKGKKVIKAEPKVTKSKKVTEKSTGKTKTASEKKASVSKKETGKSAGPAKENTPPAKKSSKSKSKTAQSAPSKKTKKSSEK